MRCMHMVYRGLGALISTTFSQDTLKKVLQAAGKRKSKNTMVHLMDAVRAQGRAGPATSVMYRRGKWHPDPERTVLALTGSNLPGWYFVGMSLHGAYHSIILAIDKHNPREPKIYLMDQFTRGFVKNVTGRLSRYMKKEEPSYGCYASTKFWPIYPVSDTLIEIKTKRIFKI